MLSVSANAQCFLWVVVLFWNLAIVFCTLLKDHTETGGGGASIPFTAQTLAWRSYKSLMMKRLVAMWHFLTRCLETDVPLPEEEARIQLLGSFGQWPVWGDQVSGRRTGTPTSWRRLTFLNWKNLEILDPIMLPWSRRWAGSLGKLHTYLFLCPKNWDEVKSPCVLGWSSWVNSGFLFVFKLPIIHPTHDSFS